MGKYLVNEATGEFADMPGNNIEVETEGYLERASHTVFIDANTDDVLSMRTDKVRTTRRVED